MNCWECAFHRQDMDSGLHYCVEDYEEHDEYHGCEHGISDMDIKYINEVERI